MRLRWALSLTCVLCCWVLVESRGNRRRKFEDDDDDDDEEKPIFNYNQYLRSPYSTKVDTKSKVDVLGGILKGRLNTSQITHSVDSTLLRRCYDVRNVVLTSDQHLVDGHIHALKGTGNKEIDIIFLVDSSTSVGKNNFKEEIKFVKKLLSDFTVDVNHTRVSVITFSSRDRVIRHIDYLDDVERDRHKCSLLEEDLKGITYSGGGTYTLGAFKEAKKVFKNSRPSANKAIFLVTDGFSNGGDPRAQARAFRNMGVKVFTFGIENGNVRELYDMASAPQNESCYILDSFEEFEALARRALHEDLHSGRYIEQPDRKCDRLCVGKDCCDDLATCNCGTHTGQYECICPPGYYGNGLRGGCLPCPSGTYKPDMRPGDDYTCSKCPDEKHITEPGATKVEQCICQKGFRTFNGTGCAVLKCPTLAPPRNGYFVNDKCKNVFNAACGLKCKPGYELRGSSLRICQEDGTWSGSKTDCIMKTCPVLMVPKNGNMICTTDDFTFNTVCRFTCDTGYKLVGSRKRTCLAIAFWTGINTRCREITCRPLPVVRDGIIHPSACTALDVTFGTTCSITCSPGYSLIGPHSKQCLPEGVWTPEEEVNQCVDTSPPFIICPNNIEIDSDVNENTGTVKWQVPLAVDNSGYIPILTPVPAVLPPAQFVIGRTKVTYEAEDLNKNKASCQFYIIVKDRQKPTIDRCVSPMPIVSPEQYAEVEWEEPEFSDNSEEAVRIQRSHAPGLFPRGITEVVYTAFDPSGNNNTCTIKINVIPHPCQYPPIPLNGNRTCYETGEGVVCKFSCKEGYRFGIPPAPEYLCAYDNIWTPKEKIPVPDCTALKIAKRIEQPASFTFAGQIACQHRPGLVRLEKNFEHRINKRIDQLCQIGLICGMSDLQTTCKQVGDNSEYVVLGRFRRSAADHPPSRHKREDSEFEETYTETVSLGKDGIVTFNYKLTGLVNETAKQEPSDQGKLVSSMDNIVTALKKDAKTGSFDLKFNGKPLSLVNMTVDTTVEYKCEPGSVLVDKSCVPCPAGSFFNVVSLKCESCDLGTFQGSEGQISCLVCPQNMSTTEKQTKNPSNCRALCLPGTFSDTGLEFCETCKRGYYQNKYGKVSCERCPRRHTTRKRGSRQLTDCKRKCEAGHMSKTGVEPCWPCPLGSYQSRIGKSSCTVCPGKASTPSMASTNVTQCEFEQSDGPQNEEPLDLFSGGQQQELFADECSEQPCKNGATCKSNIFTFECICADGYTGFACEEEINECEVNPCLNGGSCIDLLADYLCTCTEGFTGKKCEKNIDECTVESCLNGATCQDEVLGISCQCANGFSGLKCEVNINECEVDSCMNGGTCVDGVAGFTCDCPPGIRGDQCEINDDNCASGPCQNNAECVDGAGSYKCNCVMGFEGTNCEIDIDECALSPCGHNAKCENLPGDYKCHCPPGYTGISCKDEIDMYFQLDFPSTVTTMDYAKVKVGQDLAATTVCFWMKTDDQENQGTPFSYATSNGDNVLTLSDYDGFVLYVNGDKVTTTVKANDGVWHQICVIWTSNRGAWKIYMDGLPEDSGRNLASGQTIKGGGLLVVGQEQDVEGGDFSKPETFIGQLTQLNVWSSALTLKEIEELRTSCKKQLGDVVAWTDIAGQVHGSVSQKSVQFCTECPEPPRMDFGDVQYTGLTAGSTAYYSCDRGFNLAGRDERLCLVTGEWEGREPSCTRIQCLYPGSILNGWIEGSVYTFDNRIRYKCNNGYTLVGDTTQYCGELGFWIGNKPVCEQTTCNIAILSDNTVLTNPQPDNKFLPGSDAFFECKPGNKFFTDHTSIYCQKDGTWDLSIPTCDPQKCGMPPSILDGDFQNKRNLNEFSVGYIAQYECIEGHEFSANSLNPRGQLTCQPTGGWEDNLPECVGLDCFQPPSIEHGRFDAIGTKYLDSADYLCDEGYIMIGEPYLECIETGEWDPEPPRCSAVACGPPEDILHGYFTGDRFTFGETITYNCDLGYKLVGEQVLECLANELWSYDAPVCKPISCGRPDVFDNGVITGRQYTLNHVITYSCNDGYVLEGSTERVCRETGQWSTKAPFCKRLSCGSPPEVQHGFYSEVSYEYLDTVTYRCDDGYSLQGQAVLTCGISAQWSPAAPLCLQITCAVPPAIQNGLFQNAASLVSFNIGFRAQYVCNEGYEFSLNSLNPIGQIECTASGAWEANLPECVKVQCRNPLPVTNGNYVYGSLTYLSEVEYSCNDGYRLQGVSVIRCMANAAWSAEAPTCIALKCEAPPYVLNGRVNYKDLTLGSVIRYMCLDGYRLEGLEVRRCLQNLTWSGVEPACVAISCGEPEDVDNGFKVADGNTFQSTVTYNCNSGYYLSGDRTRLCTKDGVWSGSLAVCNIVQCDRPSRIISNGRMIGDVFSYGSVVTYECDEGYNLDVAGYSRRCLAGGEWDLPIPSCTAVECPRLRIRNGQISGFQTEYGTTLTVTCNSGYRLEGSVSHTCQQDGTWSGKATYCTKFVCPRLSPPTNGQVFVQNIDATYLCLEGYKLNGPSTRTCQADDTWSGSDPSCDAIFCEDITKRSFPDGYLIYDSLTYGSSVVFECKSGFLLKGNRQIECQADGQWTGAMPFCERKKCFKPYVPFNSRLIGDDFSYGSTISFACDEGFLMSGVPNRTCQAYLDWSGSAITCDEIICSRPVAGSNVNIEGNSFEYGSNISISCNSGYKLVGPTTRTCTDAGVWSGVEPTCILNECPRLPKLRNGKLIGRSYDQGSRISYQCNEGYRLSGLSFRLCLGNLKWSGNDPVCKKVSCGEPPPLDYGYVNGDNWLYQDTVQYVCNEGYNLVGENRRQCLYNGRWAGADPVCIGVSCGVPRLPKNALFTLPDGFDEGLFEMKVELSCDVGYQGVGSNVQQCQANGQWTASNFECRIVECGEYSGLQNGRFTRTGITFGAKVTLQCDDGYKLLGGRDGLCKASGYWEFDAEPSCVQISCPEVPAPTNGQYSFEGSPTVGQEVVYRCNEGYRLQGDNRRFCQLDGRWSGADPYCRLVICTNPPYVANSKPFDTTTQYFFRSEARYACKTGYFISKGNHTLTCSETGEWGGHIPTCSRVQCGVPEDVKHGWVDIESSEYKSNANYVCNSGYRIKGNPTITCDQNGLWVGTLPECVPISCGAPPQVSNSILLETQGYTFNSRVTYQCEDGYQLKGQQTSTCLATGIWSGTPPECQPISCGFPPNVANAYYNGQVFEYKSTVTYECNYGYDMTGDPILVCLSTGSWSANRPICHEITCGPPPVIAHSHTTTSMESGVGSVAYFECNDGYSLQGSTTAYCTPEKQWEYSAEVPSCLMQDCGQPDGVNNGYVEYTLTTYGSEAKYTCKDGYRLSGQSSRNCNTNGQWGDHLPSCDPVDCGKPPLTPHVTLTGSSYVYGDVVEYGCDEGYVLAGDQTHECQADGFWSGEYPICNRIECPSVAPPRHGWVKYVKADPGDSGIYSGDSVVFYCEDGFEVYGKTSSVCTNNGRWNEPFPTCKIDTALLQCGEDTGIPEVALLDSPYPVGASVDLTCRPGYTTNSLLRSTCQEDQTWSSPTGQCRRISCGKPVLRDFVNVVRIRGGSYLYGDTISYRCRAGVMPARLPALITCQVDGNWDGDIRCGVTCKQPCQNGGICLGLNRCKCQGGYGGRVCEKAICVLPCLNGGKCLQPYTCTCPQGYGGVRCNQATCSKPCQNGGKCVLPNKCKCSHGFRGRFCERTK